MLVFVVAPQNGLLTNTTRVVDRDVIGQFFKHVHHLRTRNGVQERMGQNLAVCQRSQRLCVVAAARVPVGLQLVCRALLVVAFRVGNQVLVVPTALLVDAPFEVAVVGVSHSRLVVLVYSITPKHHAVVAQLFFLVVRSPVLEDDVKVLVDVP